MEPLPPVPGDTGKAAVCQNNFRHGMSGAFGVLPHENQDEFDGLALRESAEKRKEELHKWAVLLAEAKLTHQQVLTNDVEIDHAIAEMAQKHRPGLQNAA